MGEVLDFLNLSKHYLNMKRILFSIISIVMCIGAFAQVSHSSVSEDGTSKEILNELKEIRKNQELNRYERDSVRNSHLYNSVQHKVALDAVPQNEYGAMLKIADNTSFDTKAKVGWWVAIFAFIVSGVSMYYAIITYKAQTRTERNTQKAEENTKRVSQEAQRKLLNELLRHLYRNYVITYTMRTKMIDINYEGYPSEEHFIKLKVPMENIHLDAFYGEDQKFQYMHVLYLNLRNYNDEIEIAMKHIIDPDMAKETKDEDFDTLEFKVSYLTGRIIETIYKIWGESESIKREMLEAMEISLEGVTNSTDNINADNTENFRRLTVQELLKTKYTLLYSGEQLNLFCNIFNHDVQVERMQNARGAWKVRMISF